ncbi:hypothetical protein FACS189429_0730 [Bacteroidia bacterium]|nr:hypothetical protein FACS189429_0730 [Bacteroidia bacterium]
MTTSLQNIENRSRLFGSIGSLIICSLVFLLLFFSYLPKIQQYTEESIMVSFGDSFDGGGTGGDYGGSAGGNMDEGGYATQQTAETPVAQSVTQSITAPDNALATQDDLSGAYAAQQAAAEAARQKAIRDAEAARIAEEQRIQQEKIDRANRMGSALAGSEQAARGSGTGFGAGSGTGNASRNGTGNGSGTGSGVGDGSGSGRQGNPAGRGNPNGSWLLTGRELVGNLANPAYTKNIEGKITITIRVDEAGSVVGTSVGSPTTISDTDMHNAARAAAKKNHFTKGSGIAQGTITYYFNLH